MLTDAQRFAIERKAGMAIAREGIRQCQWSLSRPKKTDPVGCASCVNFAGRACEFRKFLDVRGDKKAWVAE